jgi:Domain of unknown function (DUF4249)
MKKYLFTALLSTVLLLSSCEKVIDIDLNSEDPYIVIEAEVTNDNTAPQTVRITKSLNFSDNNTFPAVSGAAITLSDDAGNSVSLTETSPGIYQTNALPGIPGRTYTLNIVADGNTYYSVCKMPTAVSLDTLLTREQLGPGPGGSGKSILPIFVDPTALGDKYRFRLAENGEFSSSILLMDDDVFNGSTNVRTLNVQDLTLESGDTATVELLSISEAVHFYFFSLSQNGSGPNASASPANPKSNIEGATLGYFSAHCISRKSILVQ